MVVAAVGYGFYLLIFMVVESTVWLHALGRAAEVKANLRYIAAVNGVDRGSEWPVHACADVMAGGRDGTDDEQQLLGSGGSSSSSVSSNNQEDAEHVDANWRDDGDAAVNGGPLAGSAVATLGNSARGKNLSPRTENGVREKSDVGSRRRRQRPTNRVRRRQTAPPWRKICAHPSLRIYQIICCTFFCACNLGFYGYLIQKCSTLISTTSIDHRSCQIYYVCLDEQPTVTEYYQPRAPAEIL